MIKVEDSKSPIFMRKSPRSEIKHKEVSVYDVQYFYDAN